MANIKSAKKRAKQMVKRNIENSQKRSKLRTFVKKVRGLAAEGKKDEAVKIINETFSVIDKTAKTKLIHPNKAARLKSKLSAVVK